MMAENRYPTIRDLRDAMTKLVNDGLGDHPVQVVIAPASTMWAVMRNVRLPHTNVDEPIDGRPPLMIEFPLDGVDRIGVCLVSTDYLSGTSLPGKLQ